VIRALAVLYFSPDGEEGTDVRLQGQTIFITGASSGIGRACARVFAREGARLVLAARRVERLEDLAGELEATQGTESLVLPLDVRDRRAVETAVAGLPGSFAQVELLLNNAGLARGLAPLQEGDPDDWEEMIDTNVKGLLWVTRAVVPGMVARGRGHVINIGSIAGREAYPKGHVYCATKFAVDALTRGLRMDLVETGVRVSEVAPGLVRSEFSLVRHRGNRERAERTYGSFRVLEPEDVAEAVLFCATRPPHVTIQSCVITPKDQASIMVHRGKT
jgi:serine 3-dehydrogenase